MPPLPKGNPWASPPVGKWTGGRRGGCPGTRAPKGLGAEPAPAADIKAHLQAGLTCDGVQGSDGQQYDNGHINIQSHCNLDKYGSRKYICLWWKGRIGPLSPRDV